MARNLILPLGAALLLASCAASPLYVQSSSKYRGTVGEIPRDGRGEPVWDAIRNPPPPPAAVYVPPAPGIPVTGPGAEAFAPPPTVAAAPLVLRPAATEKDRRRACRHWRSCR